MSEETSTFTASDVESAASAIASPDTSAPETPSTEPTSLTPAPQGETLPVQGTPPVEAPVPPEKPKGPIPFEVHSKALENARAKARDEGVAEYRQKYGWAEQIPQADLQRWGQTADRLLKDPVQYAEDLLAELEAHPQYGPQMKAQTARRLASYRQRQEATQPVAPDVQIVDGNNRVIGMTYSDKALQQRDAQLREQLKQELQADWQARIDPLEKARSAAETREHTQRIEANVDRQLAEAATWPHFLEHQQAIGIEIQKGAALKDAYNTVFVRDIYPQTQALARADVMNHLKSKPAASTVSPSGGSTSVPTADSEKSFEQLFAEKAQLFGVR